MNIILKKMISVLNKQIVRFAFVGVSNIIVSYIAYLITIWFTSGMYIIANIMGFVFGTFNAYILNSKFVFKSANSHSNDIYHMFKTFFSYGVTCLVNTGLLFLLVEYLHISKVIAPLINSVIIFILNFILNKFWVYKDQNGEKDEF